VAETIRRRGVRRAGTAISFALLLVAGACTMPPAAPAPTGTPFDSYEWSTVADGAPWGGRAGVETVLLAAPTTPDGRLSAICERSRGFVYGVGLLGVTGERDELALTALEVARRLKDVTDRPVLIGFGVSTAAHAVAGPERPLPARSQRPYRRMTPGSPHTAADARCRR
jgi:hypothetical protein